MYFVENKLCFLIIFGITTNKFFISTSPISDVYISASDLDLTTFITMRTEACNRNGCFYPMKFFFVEGPSVVCPIGFDLKLAYKDQEGRYRVGSLNTNKSTKKILENCVIKSKKEIQSEQPNYMKSTKASEAKTRTKFFTQKSTTQLPRLNNIQQNEDDILASSDENRFRLSNHQSDIMTNDLSEISDGSFKTVQLTLEDELNGKNSFPQNMFDDKGDAIYGTGLLTLLLSLICALVKFILEKQKNKQLSDLHQNLPKTSTFIAPQVSSNPNQYSEPFITQNLTPHVSETIGYHTALPNPPTASQLTALAQNDSTIQHTRNSHALIRSQLSGPGSMISQQVAQATFNSNCNCPTGNCIKGNCHCYKAKRACGPTCHGGNGTSINCKATVEHAAIHYNII